MAKKGKDENQNVFIRDSEVGMFMDFVVENREPYVIENETKQDMGRIYQRLNRYKNRMIEFHQVEQGRKISPYQYIMMRKDFETYEITILFDDPNRRTVRKTLPNGEVLRVPGGVFLHWREKTLEPDFWTKTMPELGLVDEYDYLKHLLKEFEEGTIGQTPDAEPEVDKTDPTLDQEKDLF